MRSYLQEPVAQALPDASLVTIDKQHYYRQFLHGYYQFDCGVGEGVIRSSKFYIPEGSVYNQPTVFIGVPGGSNPWEFMVDSGWKELSDQYGLYLVLMEAKDEKGWNNDKEDLDYLNALNNDLAVRPMFCSFQANFYAVAYGDCADAVGAQSRMMPRAYAALALLGTKGMTEEEVRTLQASPSRVEGISLSEVQWPVWLGFAGKDEAARRMIGYYRHSNHSMESPVEDGSRMIWHPQKGGTVASCSSFQ